MASATMEGEAGSGTWDARDWTRAGVRLMALRARVAACSGSDSSLRYVSFVYIG